MQQQQLQQPQPQQRLPANRHRGSEDSGSFQSINTFSENEPLQYPYQQLTPEQQLLLYQQHLLLQQQLDPMGQMVVDSSHHSRSNSQASNTSSTNAPLQQYSGVPPPVKLKPGQHQQMLQQAAQFSNNYSSNSSSNQNLQQQQQQQQKKLAFPASEFFHAQSPPCAAYPQAQAQGRSGAGPTHQALMPSASVGVCVGVAGQPAVPRPGSSASTHSGHSQQSAPLQQYPTAADIIAGQVPHLYQQSPLAPTASAPPAPQVRSHFSSSVSCSVTDVRVLSPLVCCTFCVVLLTPLVF